MRQCINDYRYRRNGPSFPVNWNWVLLCGGDSVSDTVFLVFTLVGFGLGMRLVLKYLRKPTEIELAHAARVKSCPPHAWQDLETFVGSGLVYMKCKDCKKTLNQILTD